MLKAITMPKNYVFGGTLPRLPRAGDFSAKSLEKIMIDENSSQPLSVGEVAPEIKEQLNRRRQLCKAMAELPVQGPEEFRAEIARLRAEYESSAAPPPEYAELIDKDFAEAVKSAESRVQEMENRQLNFKKLEAELQRLLADDLLIKSDLDKFDAECIKLLGAIPEEFTAASAARLKR